LGLVVGHLGHLTSRYHARDPDRLFKSMTGFFDGLMKTFVHRVAPHAKAFAMVDRERR